MVILVALVALESCALGARETENWAGAGFSGVIFATNGTLIVAQGDKESLAIEGAADDLKSIVAEVRGGSLLIGGEGAGHPSWLQPPVFHPTMESAASSFHFMNRSLCAAAWRISIPVCRAIIRASFTEAQLLYLARRESRGQGEWNGKKSAGRRGGGRDRRQPRAEAGPFHQGQ